MISEYKYVDGRGNRFRLEENGDEKWTVWQLVSAVPCNDEDGGADEHGYVEYGEEAVTGLQHCESELIAARLYQCITAPGGLNFSKLVGPVVASEGIEEWAGDNEERRSKLSLCLLRHHGCDWGCVCDEVREANIANSLDGSGSILSEYVVDGRRVYVGTGDGKAKDEDGNVSDAGRLTSVFFPEESGKSLRGTQWIA